MAAAVLTLMVLEASPPVPQVSTKVPLTLGWMQTAELRIFLAKPAISEMDSPFMRRATSRAPIWASVALLKISPMRASASSWERSRPSTIF